MRPAEPTCRTCIHGVGLPLALSENSVPIDHPSLKDEPQLAIVLGTEGDGLSTQVIQETDYVVRIPMWHEVDSLNVAAASAVAFWELRAR